MGILNPIGKEKWSTGGELMGPYIQRIYHLEWRRLRPIYPGPNLRKKRVRKRDKVRGKIQLSIVNSRHRKPRDRCIRQFLVRAGFKRGKK